MADQSNNDYTVKIGFDVDPLAKGLNQAETMTETSAKKIGASLEQGTNKTEQATQKSLKNIVLDTNKSMKDLNETLLKQNESFNKILENQTKKIKSSIETTSSGLKDLIGSSYQALGGIAGAFGVGVGVSGLFDAIKQNAQLAYRSTGLNTTPHEMSSFQQGARQSGIEGGTADALFNKVAQMQTEQFSSKAEISANARQYLTRINTLLDISDKNAKGEEKTSDEYLLSILQSVKLRSLAPMAQRAMLQDALGVDVATAGELLDPNLIKNINNARKTTAITNKQAEEAKKDDQLVESAKNRLWKATAWTIGAIDTVSTKIGLGYSFLHGAVTGNLSEVRAAEKLISGKDIQAEQLAEKKKHDQLTPQLDALFGADRSTPSARGYINVNKINQQSGAVAEDEISQIVHNKNLKQWQAAYESNRSSFKAGMPEPYNYAVGDQGRAFGAFQIWDTTANDPSMTKKLNRKFSKQDLQEYDINEMIRDQYMMMNIKYAVEQAAKQGRNLSTHEKELAGLAGHNGGQGGVDYFLKFGRTKNDYGENILDKSGDVTINQTINISAGELTSDKATTIGQTIAKHAKDLKDKAPLYSSQRAMRA